MKIEIVVDPARPAPAQSLVSRVAPPAATIVATTTRAPRSVCTGVIIRCANLLSRPASRGIRRARGRARKVTERPQKSAADLDAEMEVRVRRLTHCIMLMKR